MNVCFAGAFLQLHRRIISLGEERKAGLKIMHVVGARPNYMKVAPLVAALSPWKDTVEQVLVHTGQHYDYQMSRVFFEELDLPDPDEYLSVGSGTHAEQTARVMLAFEPVLLKHKPDWVVVVGDVNSTLACALVCSKLDVRLAHVEAGLRSGDRSMPEEINRLLTDQIADLLFTPSPDADLNLLREGVDPGKIHFVGNVMIDTLVQMLPKARGHSVVNDLGLDRRGYILVTLHRPSNVDAPETLGEIMSALSDIARRQAAVFPVHPRTRLRLEQLGLDTGSIRLIEPLGYLDFLSLMDSAALVLTDSGGIQEETTFLGIPCLTVRSTTERPITITHGTNRLVASRRQAILETVEDVNQRKDAPRPPIELWDGHAAGRIARVLLAQSDNTL
jgi:UDP-N-acetylglucosamine 2-epimerase (non-hydrolysing)